MVENALLSMKEINSLSHVICDNLSVSGTIKDLSVFYGRSRGNVRSIIHRRMMQKLKHRVYYSFNAFQKIVPEKWKEIT